MTKLKMRTNLIELNDLESIQLKTIQEDGKRFYTDDDR